MDFYLIDITHTSKSVKFIFSNDGTYQLTVKGEPKDGSLFHPYVLYKIDISRDIPLDQAKLHQKKDQPNSRFSYSQLGVITRRTRKSTHIASGTTVWSFPSLMCRLRSGVDVWITVRSNESNENANAT